MKSDNIIWTKGEFLKEHKANISMLSPSSQFGLNVFEGIRCYNSIDNSKLFLFKLDDHIDRLYDSAESLKLKIIMNRRDLKEQIISTIIKK